MRIFLCMPTYDMTGHLHSARAFYLTPSARLPIFHAEAGRSLLANCFNMLWASALNLREPEGITHFAMLHSDVIPEDYWLDRLYEELTKTKAALVSTVLPIKDLQGITSAAISGEDEWEPERRLTMREIYALPETFSAADCGYPDRTLMVNTGCWLADLSFPGFENIAFQIRDRIVKNPNGGYSPQCIPEDWNFSQEVFRAGGKIVATRKVKAIHVGPYAFPNTAPWGSAKVDPVLGNNKPLPVM